MVSREGERPRQGGKRSAHQKRGRKEDEGREERLREGDGGRPAAQPCRKTRVGGRDGGEQRRREEREQPDRRLEAGVKSERRTRPVRGSPEDDPAEAEPAHENGENEADGLRVHAEEELEVTRPEDLVRQPGRAGHHEANGKQDAHHAEVGGEVGLRMGLRGDRL